MGLADPPSAPSGPPSWRKVFRALLDVRPTGCAPRRHAAVHTASRPQVGKRFLRRLDFARSSRLDLLSYCVCTRGVGVRWRSTDRMAASGHPIDQKTGDPGISQEILTQTGTTATLGVPTSWPVGPAGARYDRIRSAERQGADNRLYAVSSAIAGGRPS